MLNKQKGNMYGFVTHTWNTVKGQCYHDCSYCYMKRFKNQKPVRFDETELKTDLGSGNFIFVGSSCDMWAVDIPREWVTETIKHVNKYNNTYLFQSKNPIEYRNQNFTRNTILCTTLETNRFYKEYMQNAPRPWQRTNDLFSFYKDKNIQKHVTIEPIINFDIIPFLEMIKTVNPEQVNIGADTGGHNLPEPTPEKIHELINELSKFTKVHLKDNLKRLYVSNNTQNNGANEIVS